jgi:hypothetical protein
MLKKGPTKSPKSNNDLSEYSRLSIRFREAAASGKKYLILELLTQVLKRDQFGIDIKIAFDLAAKGGHLPVLKLLYKYLQPKSTAMSGLFEAARFGRILTVKWLLKQSDFNFENNLVRRDPKIAWDEALSTAIGIAATNQHWATMLELMLHAKQYVKDRFPDPSNVIKTDDCGLDGCHVKHSQDNMDVLLIQSFDNLRLSSVYIPSSCHIPKPVIGKANIENELTRHKPRSHS